MNKRSAIAQSLGLARARAGHSMLDRPDWLSLYQREVVPRLTVGNVFGELARVRRVGAKLRAPCPLHGGNNPNFVIDPRTLRWFCHSKCNVGGGPLEFIHLARGGKGALRGRAFLELVQKLCSEFGVDAASEHGDSASVAQEVEHVWALAKPVTSDRDVASWLLRDRGLDPELIDTANLARVLPWSADLPQWAGFHYEGMWRSWPSTGYRVIVPLVNASGELVSLRFRKPCAGTKGRSARGVSSTGMVMADASARVVLRSGRPPSFWSGDAFVLVVAEGEPDFWSWATESARRGLAEHATSFPAVIGVVSGSFDQSIADRLPLGTHVISAMHADEGGDRIHARIAAVLAGAHRGFTLSRWSAS